MSAETIKRLGDEFDSKWLRVEELSKQALTGLCHVDVVCGAIRDALSVETELRCEQIRHAVESVQAKK